MWESVAKRIETLRAQIIAKLDAQFTELKSDNDALFKQNRRLPGVGRRRF